MIQDRQCRGCMRNFPGGPRAYYCPSCRVSRKKLHKATYAHRKRSGESRVLGRKDACERCGKEYTVEGSLQRFCPECQPIHALEYDRETSLPFYHANKARINPPRKLSRRKRNDICVMCGNKFDPINGSNTCSAECKRKRKNQVASESRKRIRD